MPGIYAIKAERAGFRLTEIRNVELPVARTVTQNIAMQLGAVTQTMEVAALAPLLDTATATVGTVVNNQNVVALPLNGRYFTDLILLIPGSVPTAQPLFMVAGGTNFAVSGSRYEQMNYTLDGVNNNETFFKQFGIQPSIDAIQEFKIQTNITSAEFGGAAGANVSVAIKSGTNQLRGSVFEFLRNDAVDANDFFRNYNNLPKPAFRLNQYGGVLGGPVYLPRIYDGRDRAFWLFNYEGSKVRRASTAVGTIPTRTQFSGDLRDQPPIFDPATTRVDPVTGNLIRDRISCDGVVNVICPDRIDPFVEAYTSVFYPMTDKSGAGNVVNTSPFRKDAYQFTTRVDYKIRENLTFFARYSYASADQVAPRSLPAVRNILSNRFHNAAASWTYVLNVTTVVDFKLGLNRNSLVAADSNPPPGAIDFLAAHPMQGTPVKNDAYPLYPTLSIGGYTSPSQTGYPFRVNNIEGVLNVTKIQGRHSLKTGFDVTNMRNYDDGLATSTALFTPLATADPQGVAATGSSLASYLLGLPNVGIRQVGDTAARMRAGYYQFYIQDDLKLTRRLTLNMGLRYEWNQFPRDESGHASMFDPLSRQWLWAGKNPLTGQGPNTRQTIVDPDFNNFAPRVGLAYGLTSKTTIRSGYGIFYSSNFLWEGQGFRGQWPYAVGEFVAGQNVTFPDHPVTAFFSPNNEPKPGDPATALYSLGRTDRSSYSQQWNLGVQHALANDFLLEVNYVGTRGLKLIGVVSMNDPPPGPGAVGSPEHPRPFPEQGPFAAAYRMGSSVYHTLQVKLDKRFSGGLQFLGSYTWGKYIETGGSGLGPQFFFGDPAFPQNDRNWKADRALGMFDRRHIFTYSFFYQLPFGRGKRFVSNASGPLNQLLGGWELTGITTYRSGAPVNVSLILDNANVGQAFLSQRPDRVTGQPARAILTGNKTQGWLNPAGFRTPAPFTFGDLGRNTETGPGFGNWDLGLFKNFPLVMRASRVSSSVQNSSTRGTT